MEIVAFVTSIGALLIAALAALYTRKQAVATQDLVRIEGERRAEEEATAARQRVVWRLRRDGPGRLRLFNEGVETAYGITIGRGGRSVSLPQLAAGATHRLPWYGVTLVGVTWHHLEDESDEPTTKAVYLEQ